MAKSTEQLLAKFEEYNKTRVGKGLGNAKIVIASMDIKKWYPNMLVAPMAKEIRKMISDSEIEFDGIDHEAITKYLGKQMTKEEILAENLQDEK